MSIKAATLFFILMSCGQKDLSTNCYTYPKQIDSLQIRDLYDTARLYLFTWVCDEKDNEHFRGEYVLEYKSFFLQNDSIELFFSHYIPNEKSAVYRSSFAFNLKTKQKLWGWDINGFSHALQPGDPRFESPASPEVVDFIKGYKQILNPCFLDLAKRAKVITD